MSIKRGFSVHFDRLDEFLQSQDIRLDQKDLAELTYRYVGNNIELRSKPVSLTFNELEQLLE